MASDKRSFKDFKGFPGSIVGGEYRFDKLNWTNAAGKPMIWQGFVRLVPTKNIKKYAVNWSPADEEKDMIPIIPDHLEAAPIPDGAVGQIWSVSGRADLNPTTNIPTFIKAGKNIGRANETNVFTQALITMRSKHLKKIDGGYISGDAAPAAAVVPDANAARPYYMMAYHKWIDKPRDPTRHIKFPAAVSIKFDGTRVQVHSTADRIVFSSRRKKLFPSKPYLEQNLQKLFTKYPNIYLDAEAFIEDSNLNIITGIMTRESGDGPSIMLNVFDMFVPVGEVVYRSTSGSGSKDGKIMPESSFADRSAFLDHVFSEFAFEHIHRIDQEIITTEKEYDEYHELAVADGNEGTVIRNLATPYEFSDRREIRSYHVRKRKPRYDDTFAVVDYTQGTSGGAVGAIIMVLETKKDGHRFNADPENITIPERHEIYKNMTREKFDAEWKGKKLTVTYHALSADGIPLQPKVSLK
jgi:hypothetical protein